MAAGHPVVRVVLLAVEAVHGKAFLRVVASFLLEVVAFRQEVEGFPREVEAYLLGAEAFRLEEAPSLVVASAAVLTTQTYNSIQSAHQFNLLFTILPI